MTPVELAENSNASLHQIEAEYIRGGIIPVDGLQKGFIYLHVKAITGLMDDVLFLERHPQTTVARCAVRPMMESLFNIGAAIRDEAFVFNKVAWENEQWFSKLELLSKETHIPADKAKLESLASTGKEDMVRFREKYNVGELRHWNKIFKIAQLAKLGKVYEHYYSLACHHVHSNLAGILSYGSTSRGMTMRNATMIVSLTIQRAGSYIHPSRAAVYDKMAGEYIRSLESLSADGSYE